MTNLESSISGVLKELIRNKNLSISELARRTQIPQPTIYRIVHGEHQRPHNKTLKALSKFFNITIEQLLGLEPFRILTTNQLQISQIPLLNLQQVLNWPQIKPNNTECVMFEKLISTRAFAIKMPDKSMEPLITKDSLLIVDPEKDAEYRSLVVVKLHHFSDIVVRQLIKDAGNCYIRPLSQDFDKFEMIMLSTKDLICLLYTSPSPRD